MNRKQRRAAIGATGGTDPTAIRPAVMQILARGIHAHQAGLLAQAETSYRQAIALDPNRPEICNNLGLVLQGQGKLPAAVAAYRKAIALAPDTREAHFNLGIALAALGRPAEAVAAYQNALELMPDYPELHYELGNALRELGRFDAAIGSFRRAIALQPNYADAYTNLGALLKDHGEPSEAVAAFRRAVALNPDSAEACNNLGLVLYGLGHLDEAAAAHRRAVALRPRYADAHANLGIVLHKMGRLQEAVVAYRHALAAAPDHAGAYNNLGVVQQELGNLNESLSCHRHANALRPGDPQALNNLGLVLQETGQLDAAEAAYRQALAHCPDFCGAISNLTLLRLMQCDWQGIEENAEQCRGLVRNGASEIDPFLFLGLASSTSEQSMCARQWTAVRIAEAGGLPPRPRTTRDRIRLGYLSAKFYQHPSAVLAVELFECHDRARFEVIGYSIGPDDGSAMRRRLHGAFDRFDDIRALSHREAANRIREDEIDLLVDLTGHTRGARLPILAARPAPIQVNFLGFPGTTGAPFIDYVIADPIVVPRDEQPFFVERIVHLPDCYQPNDRKRAIAEATPSRAECGLPETGFVFCCFNNAYKFTAEFFDVWMRLLRAVPGSVLWLLAGNQAVRTHLVQEAAARGIAADRLVFAPRVANLAEHLARHRLADLFLDTLPINAHTTTSDALWAGLPVLTCAGSSFAGRVAASLLHAGRLDELAAQSLAEYEALAMRLATDPALLAELRRRLAANRSTAPLFDTERFTRNLEAAYRRMWDIWAAGKPPEPFTIAP